MVGAEALEPSLGWQKPFGLCGKSVIPLRRLEHGRTGSTQSRKPKVFRSLFGASDESIE